MLQGYRLWAKSAQVRGATDFTGAEVFWRSIKRLLNAEISLVGNCFGCPGAAASSSCRRGRSYWTGLIDCSAARWLTSMKKFSEQVWSRSAEGPALLNARLHCQSACRAGRAASS